MPYDTTDYYRDLEDRFHRRYVQIAFPKMCFIRQFCIIFLKPTEHWIPNIVMVSLGMFDRK